jgi:hypothetical protein
MKLYRTLWLVSCGGLVLMGAGVAFILAGPAMLVLFGGAAAAVGAVTRRLMVGWEHNAKVPLREVAWPVVTNSLVGGTATVAFVGMAALLGPWVFLLALLVAGGSPPAIRLLHRWVGQHPRRSGPPHQAEPFDHAYSAEIGPGMGPTLDSCAVFRSLSDAEVCQVWRASFSALQRASSLSQRMRIVAARQDCLDEFERRHPHGLTAWLASGARAAGNPSRFITGDGANHPPINWDGLIHGPDM